MADYVYDKYWKDIHNTYHDSLRSVGWPGLSEMFNKLKYKSEADAFSDIMKDVKNGPITINEVGVGIGFWTKIMLDYFGEDKVIDYCCADISASALDIVKSKYNKVLTRQLDLATVDISNVDKKYNIVTAIMVLLHLVDDNKFKNGLKFCSRSVLPNGFLILYEPILVEKYSPFNMLNCNSYDGNSFARNIATYDELLKEEGFERLMLIPGVSWLLNSPIQASNRISYSLKNAIWKILANYIFKYESITKAISGILLKADRLLKYNNPNSSYFALYKKKNV